jgi:hypothetical protein
MNRLRIGTCTLAALWRSAPPLHAHDRHGAFAEVGRSAKLKRGLS